MSNATKNVLENYTLSLAFSKFSLLVMISIEFAPTWFLMPHSPVIITRSLSNMIPIGYLPRLTKNKASLKTNSAPVAAETARITWV